MKKTDRSVLLILSVIAPFFLYAQAPILGSDHIANMMQVKQIEEFMARFNREETPIVMDSATTHKDMKMLALLFDADVLEKRAVEVVEFAEAMLRDDVKLHFTDTTWVAIANCKVKYKKQQHDIVLYLRTEHIEENMYKWVIMQAEGDLLILRPQKRSKSYKISPTDNELYFMQLADITGTEPENILNYSRRCFKTDQTSVFFSLVASGQLQVEYVEQLTYYFQTSHYNFFVNYYSREGTNSGWLISDFEKL